MGKVVQMQRSINLALLVFAFLTALLFKFFFSSTEVGDLKFILYPTTLLVEAITSYDFHWIPDTGYCMEGSRIIIEKTCSGLNFFMISYCMATFMLIPATQKPLVKLAILPGFVVVCFLVTIGVNAFRISTALFLLQHFQDYPLVSSELGHLLQGTIFYFSFLIIFYLSLEIIKRFKKNKHKVKSPIDLKKQNLKLHNDSLVPETTYLQSVYK